MIGLFPQGADTQISHSIILQSILIFDQQSHSQKIMKFPIVETFFTQQPLHPETKLFIDSNIGQVGIESMKINLPKFQLPDSIIDPGTSRLFGETLSPCGWVSNQFSQFRLAVININVQKSDCSDRFFLVVDNTENTFPGIQQLFKVVRLGGAGASQQKLTSFRVSYPTLEVVKMFRAITLNRQTR